jgi:PAS domain S-box-containing protein
MPESEHTADSTEQGDVHAARFRTILQNIPDYAIFMIDPQGFVVEWSDGAQRVKGYTPKEAIGLHLSVFYTPTDRAHGTVERELNQAAMEGRTERENWRVRKGGEWFWGNEIATAIRDSDGKLVGFTKITRDLTQRKAMEDELRQSDTGCSCKTCAITQF